MDSFSTIWASWLKSNSGLGLSAEFYQITNALMSFCYDATNDLMEAAAEYLPVALPVLGICVAAFLGVKFIKKVMK